MPTITKARTWIPALAFLIALLAIGTTGFLLFERHALEMQRAAQDGLAAIADLKVGQIVRWLGEQQGDSEAVSGDNLLADEAERWFQQGTPEGVTAQRILARLASLRQVNNYKGIVLLDEKAHPRLSVGQSQKFDSHDMSLALQAMRENVAMRSDIHWADDQAPEMDMVAPLSIPGTPGPRVIGAVYFHIDPTVFFFPYIQSWPIKSPSGETLLARRDGNEVLYLNELRHRKHTALKLRLPVDEPLLPVAMALRGQIGVVDGIDYRGVPVIAVTRRVPDTPWILVAKLDRAEVRAPIRGLAATAGGLVVLFMVMASAVAALWWRKQHAQSLAALSEEKLQRQVLEKHFDLSTKFARDIVFLDDTSFRVVECNDAALKTYGYSLEELRALEPGALRAPEARSTFEADFRDAERVGGNLFETVHQRKDGSTFPVETSTRMIEIEGRRYYHAVVRDITERRAAQQALERELAKHHALMNTAIDGIHIVDIYGHLLEANPAFLRMLGYQRGEAIGLHVTDWDARLTPDEVKTITASLIGASGIIETQHRRKDGTTYDAEVSISGFKIGDKDYLLAAARDITARKMAERRIDRLTRLYATLSHTNAAIIRARGDHELFDEICRVAVEHGGMFGSIVRIADTEVKILRAVACSKSMQLVVEEIAVGFDPARPEFKGVLAAPYLEDRITIDNAFGDTNAKDPWRAIPYAAGIRSAARLPIRRGGRPIGILTLNSKDPGFFDPEMRVLLEELVVDISFALDNFEYERRRKQAEQELIESEERFRGLVEQSISGIVIIQDGRIAYLNPRAVEIFGYDLREEMLGHETMELVAERDRSLVAENLRRRLSGEVKSIAYTFTGLRKDGTTVDIGAHGTLANYRGRPAIIGVIQDITDRKRAEDEVKRYLEEIERAMMATVGVASNMGEMRDPYTAGHQRRVADLTAAIGEEMGLPASQVEGLRVAGNLHDIGKITVPSEILAKPGKISATEFSLIKEHAQQGYEILKDVRFPWPVAQVAQQHHERLDGSGYPQGLKGDAIVLEARILAVADTVEAMASHRPYRPGRGIEAALAEVEKLRGSKYDPAAVDACLRLFREKGYQLPE